MTPRFAAVGLVATDLARSIEFYRLLGLTFPDDAAGLPHVEADLPGGLRLMIDPLETVRSFDPGFEPSPAAGAGPSLAFELDRPDEVDACHAAVVAAGFDGHLAPWDAVWGQRYATVLDPDGNSVDLFAALPPAV